MKLVSTYTALTVSAILAVAVSSKQCNAEATATSAVVQQNQAADLVLKGGAIYTMDAVRSWAQSVAISDHKIIFVGSDQGAKQFIGNKTRVIDLQGRMVLPGLHDCHTHPLSGAIEREGIDLAKCKTPEEIQEMVKAFATSHPKAPWISGAGWRSPVFVDANPNKKLLDAVVSDRPVYLASEDGHSAWVNSKALELAKVTRQTKDPETGTIERDKTTGEPSGTLRESAANIVSRLLPAPDAAHRLELLQQIQNRYNRRGITTIQDAYVDEPLLETYAAAARQGLLHLRVKAALGTDLDGDSNLVIEKLSKMRASISNCTKLTADTVKIFADGVIESHTAALNQPYLDRVGWTGILNYKPDVLNKLVTALDAADFQVHIHAIGDRAVHSALDAYEEAAKINHKNNMRHQIAHLQLVDPADIHRFRDLGVIANFQPFWCVADEYMTQQTEPVLGPERSKWQYPMAAIEQSGAVIVGGSDWPVTTFDPFEEMEVAIRHIAPSKSGHAWNPEQRVDLPTILAAYTIKGSYACKQENELGSIETGKLADLIVLDQNLFSIPPEKIHKTQVLLTLIDGMPVYEDSSLTSSH